MSANNLNLPAKISIRGSRCLLSGIDRQMNSLLENTFSYKIQNAELTDTYLNGGWNGIHYIYLDRRFPVGLVRPVVTILKEHETDVEIIDHRQLGKSYDFSLQAPPNLSLWPFQEEIVRDALQYKACSIQVATGGGKTLIAAEYIRQHGLKTLFIVPSKEILKQTVDRLEDYLGFPVGIVGDSKKEFDHITVATWQSLKTADQQYFDSIDSLIIDEAQHIGTNILRNIANNISATYRLGMSGTLFREDGADLEIIATTGPIIRKIGYNELINGKYLVPAKIHTIRLSHPRQSQFATYNDIYDNIVVQNEQRNKIIVDIANELIEQGKKVLIFVTKIEHGAILGKTANNSRFLYSSHPDRNKIIDDFKTGKIQCLITTSMLDEGYDLPIIDAVILAAPSKSLIKTIQRIGRALRKYPGKTDATIIDVADDVKYLWSHFKRRLNRYQEEKLWVIDKIYAPKKDPNDEWE